MCETPVALVIFNRPDLTRRVFAEIARARPPKLFVIADGPRSDHDRDVEECAEARAATEQVTWDCEVIRYYADHNLGCGLRPATGLDRVFQQVEEAIILEDDCVPRPSFFRFCDELLARYRDDDRVMMVGGRYSQYRMEEWAKHFIHSYTFAFNHTNWGWATWRRAWEHFDLRMERWPRVRDTAQLFDMFEPEVARFWTRIFEHAHSAGESPHFWDYQWTFACFARRGLAVLPSRHLVSNVGFGDGATHTRRIDPGREWGAVLDGDLSFPLLHPPEVARHVELDRMASARILAGHDDARIGWRRRIGRRLRRSANRFARPLVSLDDWMRGTKGE